LKIDTNGDGSIDKSEFASFTKKMQDAIKQQEASTASTYTAQGDVNYEAVGSTVNTVA
jgi:Ca2+-binding EF-hand superfamily protein